MPKSLVTQVAAWSEGSIDDPALLTVFTTAQESVQSHREGFAKSVAALEPQQLDHCGPLIDFAQSLLDSMTEELKKGRKALAQSEQNAVFVVAEQIRRSSFQLNQTFIEFRHQALLSMGPTAIPSLNLLMRLQKNFSENPSPLAKKALLDSLQAEIAMAKANLQQLDRDESDIDLLPTLKRVLQEQQRVLERFEAALKRDDKADSFAYILTLQGSYSEIQRLLPVVAQSQQTRGQTDFPDLNLLLKLMQDVSTGQVGDEPLLEVLENVEASFIKFSEELEERQQIETSVLAQDEIERALESFVDFDAGVEALYSFFESRDVAALGKAQKHLLTFASALSQTRQNLDSPPESVNQNNCLMCGAPKQPGATKCPKCGAPIITLVKEVSVRSITQNIGVAAPPTQEPLLVTEELAKVYLAVDKMAADKSNDKEFLEQIQAFESHLKTSLNGLASLPKQADKTVQSQYEHFQAALTNIGTGTKLLKRFVTDRDEAHLKDGVLKIDRGAKALNQLSAAHR